MKLTTAIHFNHELDLLEAQLAEASYYSDRIVVKEGEVNWRGEEKPLHATDNWDRFRKYTKAEVMVIPAGEFAKSPQSHEEMRINEQLTRTYGWQDVSDSVDYVLEVDVDEIIDRRCFPVIQEQMDKGYLHLVLKYANFLWYMNNRRGSFAGYRMFKTGERKMCLSPKGRSRLQLPGRLGWHFSGCLSGEGWERKYTDMHWLYGFSEKEVYSLDWKRLREQRRYVDKNRDEIDLHGSVIAKVNLDEYPIFVVENPELFPWWGDMEFIK